MQRQTFQHDGLTFSWLDAGGDGPVLVALHAHWMEAATFTGLAEELAPGWRVVALDQRGHGHSDHAASYTREDYLCDLEAILDEVGADGPVVLLGNSLGGINALQFAARHPERVRGLIIEDIAVEVKTDIDFVLAWAGTFPTREALAERVGARMTRYLEVSFRSTPEGWRLAFSPEDMVRSQNALKGEYWTDWLASACPALVIRGRESRVTTGEEMEAMAARRANTTLVVLEGGHVVHEDDPDGYAEAVGSFIRAL